VKDSAAVHHDAEHLLQTKRLGAELRVVVVELAALALFVFDRDKRAENARPLTRPADTLSPAGPAGGEGRGEGANLDDIAFPGQPEPFRPDGQRATDQHAPGDFVARQIRMLTRQVAEDGVLVFLAIPIDGLQRRPARAVEEVVEEAEGKRFHWAVRHANGKRG